MVKFFKWLGIGVLALFLLLAVIGFIANEPLPTNGKAGPKADALAQKMMLAVNQPAWDSTRFIGWQFRTGTEYLWDKDQQLVRVAWDEHIVLLKTNDQTGKVFTNGKEVTAPALRDPLLKKAWANFANDSFWLYAPLKAFDPGTTREIVQKDGREHLLVRYSSGGVTPGDSYLWELDDTGKPVAYQMWVSIIPVGGLRFTWEAWQGGGAHPLIATKHEGKLFGVPIENLSFPSKEEALPLLR